MSFSALQELIATQLPNETTAEEVLRLREFSEQVGSPDDLLTRLGDPRFADLSAWALGKLGVEGAVDALIERGLRADDRQVRKASAIALGDLQDARAVTPLMTMVADSAGDEELRAIATLASGRIGSDLAEPTLSSLVRDQTMPAQIRGAAAEALTYLTVSPTGLEALRGILRTEIEAEEVVFWAVFALGEVGEETDADLIRGRLNDRRTVGDVGRISDEAAASLTELNRRWRH